MMQRWLGSGQTLQEEEVEEWDGLMPHGAHLQLLVEQVRGQRVCHQIQDGLEILLGQGVHHEIKLDLLVLDVADVESGFSDAKPGLLVLRPKLRKVRGFPSLSIVEGHQI